MGSRDIATLFALHAYQSHPDGIELSSGETAAEYVDCRRALGNPDVLAWAVRDVRFALLDGTHAVGGPALGAVPIAVAVALHTFRRWFCVRGSAKDHGTREMVEGLLHPGDRVCLVDDVLTTGRGLLRAAHHCRERGAQVVQVIVLVDREQGGLQAVRKELGSDVPILALCTMSEIRDQARRGLHG